MRCLSFPSLFSDAFSLISELPEPCQFLLGPELLGLSPYPGLPVYILACEALLSSLHGSGLLNAPPLGSTISFLF